MQSHIIVLSTTTDFEKLEAELKTWVAETFNWPDLAKEQHPDWILLSENLTTTPSIDEIRNLQTITSQRPLQHSHRVVIIPQFEQANTAAQNAALKILEEPPEHTLLLITTQHLAQLLPTITSRCSIVQNFQPSQTNSTNFADQITQLQTALETNNIPDLLELAQELKDRETAQQFLEQSIQTIHRGSKKSAITILPILIQQLHKIRHNANTQLTLESGWLSLVSKLEK